MQEKIIKTINCKICGEKFDIFQEDKEFLEKLSPVFSGEKFLFPLPLECPICRRQKRYTWRNVDKLYRRKCDFSGENIISFYNEKVKHPVYDIDIWRSDKWDAMDYGVDFDFSKTFFEQFYNLKNSVPHFSRSILNFENSDYSNNASNLKNCYLCFNGGDAENCYYTITFKNIKNCVDCYSINNSEICYDSVDLDNCMKLFFSQSCTNCYNGYFLKDCIDCKDCFGCKNLVNKQYYIFNKQYSKEDYQIEINKLLEKYDINSLKIIFKEFLLKLPEKYIHGVNNENVSGDNINNSKDIYHGFGINLSENLRYCTNINTNGINLLDVDIFGWTVSNSYNSATIGHKSSRLYMSYDCWENADNLYYSFMCIRNCSNLFGCVGLRNKEYCILNKQYTKKEYEELIPKIIEHMQKYGEWGEFFPPYISSYGYNETEGFYFYNLDKKTAKDRGFNWSDYENPFPKVDKIIPASKLPKNIKDIPNDILNRAIECEISKKPFRIISQELEFYRKHNLPIPKRHPDQRHLDRVALKNPKKLFQRKCDKCGITLQTSYSPERKEIVYCEECYNREVF